MNTISRLQNSVLVLLVLLTFTSSTFSQNYEVYDGEFSVMFTVKNAVAEHVQFASKGATKWSDFEVIDTKNWNGHSTTGCLFTFYAVDGKLKGYQIDYYEDDYIWVFAIDDNRKPKGKGWKLERRVEKKDSPTVTLSGMVFYYAKIDKTGCLFVLPEMVDAGVAESIDPKLSNACYSEKYGYGAYLNFKQVPRNADYALPVDGKIMQYTGKWGVEDGGDVFFVNKIQPFF